jgi:carboxyl-terminal processing protease
MPTGKRGSHSELTGIFKGFVFVLVSLVSLGLVARGFYLLGFNKGLGETRNIVIQDVSNMEAPEGLEIEDTDFTVFWEAWDMLQAKHPDIGKVDKMDLIYGAIKGMTNAVGDANTVFFAPDESKRFADDIRGNFSGIGVEIGVRDGQLLVVAPLKDSPAERAGLEAGDKILAIDSEPAAGFSTEEAAKKIRGEAGTTVVLRINREGVLNALDIPIVRANIQIPAVDTSMIGKNNDVLYIQIYSFNGNLSTLFRRAIAKAKADNPKAIILDLRNNPGGFLDRAVDIAGWFLEDDQVVAIEKFASGGERVLKSGGGGLLKDLPLVVLVNGGSASASEIVAGALRVDREIQLVGENTFGKGTVQQLENLSDGSALKITIANWLLPDGTLIEGSGLIPNDVVPLTDADTLAGKDPQLDKAIELIELQMKQ